MVERSRVRVPAETAGGIQKVRKINLQKCLKVTEKEEVEKKTTQKRKENKRKKKKKFEKRKSEGT